VRLWFAAGLLIQTGCAAAVRVTIAPTVDTFGNVGGEVTVTAGVGLGRVLVQPSVGGAYLARERTGALTVRPEVTYWFEPVLAGAGRRMPALRGAFFFSGHYFWIDGREQMLNGIGGNFALLPRLYFREVRDAPHPSHPYHFIHLGVELRGEYGWGSPDVPGRGLFALGLTGDFSLYDDGD
jgi:hypothetical protein